MLAICAWLWDVFVDILDKQMIKNESDIISLFTHKQKYLKKPLINLVLNFGWRNVFSSFLCYIFHLNKMVKKK